MPLNILQDGSGNAITPSQTAVRDRLALYAYTDPASPSYPLIVRELADQIEALEFTTVAPGGFGDLTALLKLPDARIQRPELQPFARVALTDGPFCCFSGEWSDPAMVLDGTHGEYVLLSALGGGNALRDDPDDSAYTTQTAKSIISTEFSNRSAYLALDSDQTYVLPTNPVSTFSPSYDGYNLEEILHDLMFSLGDYTWGVWDHPSKKDAAGFPTWALYAAARDTTTTKYMAFAEDILSWRVVPSTQRAFNVVQLNYVDNNGDPQTVTVTDSRLGGGGARGTAPFRRRKLRRTLSRVPLTSTQATAIANAWLSSYQNIQNKVEIELASVRDGNGVAIPLSHVRADGNLYVPELAVRGQTIPTSAQAGTNQFYIVESRYRETAGRGEPRLWLALDNYADLAAGQLAQLKLAYDAALRARGTARAVISPGIPLTGNCGATQYGVAGATITVEVRFGVILAKTPSSITLSGTSSTNASSINTSRITRTGFTLGWTIVATGGTAVYATYTTVGN